MVAYWLFFPAAWRGNARRTAISVLHEAKIVVPESSPAQVLGDLEIAFYLQDCNRPATLGALE